MGDSHFSSSHQATTMGNKVANASVSITYSSIILLTLNVYSIIFTSETIVVNFMCF